MGFPVARKLIDSHLVSGAPVPGREIGLRVDQTLTQDATGTLVMPELEALGLDRARTGVSIRYVDHNLLLADEKNRTRRTWRASGCRGRRWSGPTRTRAPRGRPACSRSVGGLEFAMAIAGEPLYLRMPEIWGVRLTSALPEWVSAKDVTLEMLRRHGVKGG